MADTETTIKISGNAEEFIAAVVKATLAHEKLGKEGKKSFELMDLASAEFYAHFAERGVEKIFETFKEGFELVIDSMKEGIAEASKYEEAVTKLNYSFALSGQYSKESSEKFEKFAEGLQKTTNVSKIVISQNAQMIESLGNLSENGLERTTKAAADFAAATGKDFASASQLLGKAAEGNVEILHRFGVTIEKTGDSAKDFEKALSTIEARFGGASAAAAQTFSGKIEGLKISFNELLESVGSFIVKSPGVKGVIDGFIKVFENMSEYLKENKEAIADFIENGIDLLIEGIKSAGEVINGFLSVIHILSDAFNYVKIAIATVVEYFTKFTSLVAENDILLNATAKLFGFGDGLKHVAKTLGEVSEASRLYGNEVSDTIVQNEKDYDKAGKLVTDFAQTTRDALADSVEAAREAEESKTEVTLKGLNDRSQAYIDGENAKADLIRESLERTYEETAKVQGEEAALIQASEIDKLIAEKKYVEAKEKIRVLDEKNDKEAIFRVQKYEDLSQKEKLANLQGTLGTIATLQQSSSSELFAIGKAAALATATIDGVQAVQKALASAPPPFNFALAALVGVVQAENLSKIAGASPPKGAAKGALVTDGVPGADDQPFMLSKGEIVAPAKNFDEVVNGVAQQRGLTPGNDDEMTHTLLQQILERLPPVQVNVSVEYNAINDDLYINELTKKIREAVDFRGAQLSTSGAV